MTIARLLLVVWLAVCLPVVEAEDVWQLRGDVVAVKPGIPETVVLRLPDGRVVELPIDSLSDASQAAARRAVPAASPAAERANTESGGVTVRGPFGRSVRVPVPESIKDIEADAIHCRSAADAADVYRLALAGGRLSAEQRPAAETRLGAWAKRADEGVVRLGDRWVLPAEARTAATEATRAFKHALEVMRLGNADLAEDELRAAGRLDPESGRPGFVIGLSYALVGRNMTKAVDQLADAVRREPGNAAMLNDLAVLEVLTRRYAGVAEHFREAVEHSSAPLPIAENVGWALKLAGVAKANPALSKIRMPDKTVDDLNVLYRTLTQDLRLKPAENVAAPRFLGPDGTVCTATALADVAKLFDVPVVMSAAVRRGLGFVVAPEYVVCSRDVILTESGAAIESASIRVPGQAGLALAATVVAAPEWSDVALLKCDGLSLEPLPLAKAVPFEAEIMAVDRIGESWLDVRTKTVPGRVMKPAAAADARTRFVHAAVVSRGLGGGPIVDATGQVVGMVAPTPRTEASGNTVGFGVAVETVRDVVQEHVPQLPAHEGTNAAPKQGRAVAATVVVSSESP